MTIQETYNHLRNAVIHISGKYKKYSNINIDKWTNTALGIAHVETGGKLNSNAKNKTSTATGFMQILDKTRKWTETSILNIKVQAHSKLYEPDYSALIGCGYLAYQFNRYNGDEKAIVIGYNQGNGHTAPAIKAGTPYYNTYNKYKNKIDFDDLKNNYKGSDLITEKGKILKNKKEAPPFDLTTSEARYYIEYP